VAAPAGSLRRDLARAIIATTGGALAVSLLGLVALQITLAPRDIEQRIGGLGDVIAIYSLTAVEFEDPEAGAEALAALDAIPEASFGVLLRADGSVFARWGEIPADVDLARLAELRGLDFSASTVDWARPILSGDTRIGTLVIRSRLSGLVSRLMQITGLLVAVSLAALAVAWAIAARLRENIAGPLAQLAASAEAMAAGDLSIAAHSDRQDEIGGLATSFERMAESLRGLISQAGASTRAVSEESMRLAQAGKQMAEEARRQERATLETAGAVERLSASVSDISATALSLADAASTSDRAMAEIDGAIRQSAGSIERLLTTADASASSVMQMTASIRQIAGNAEHLAGATEATSASMRSLEATLRRVEEHARQSHSATTLAADTARRGQTVVGETVSCMHQIEESFTSVEQIIADLAQRSKAIESVLAVISEVVDQTNLLALNAAIIASQAGERGKAFAVVATEVKSLAKRTGESAGEIRASISSVLQRVQDAVKATAAGADRVRDGARRSEVAGVALREILDATARSSDAVEQIATAAGAQVEAVAETAAELERVKLLVGQIGQATREQGHASTDMQRGVEEVRALADELKHAAGEQTHQSRITADRVREVAAGVGAIRDATEQRRRDAAQILEAVQIFRDGAVEGTRRAESLEQTVQELRQRSADLEREIGRFRV
jgi:methyl-accepting chemotaxis protein